MAEDADGIIEDPDTKEEFYHVLAGIRRAMLYGLAADHVFERTRGIELLQDRHIQLGDNDRPPLRTSLRDVEFALSRPASAALLRGAFQAALFSTLVRASYEIVLHYAVKTRQVGTFKRAPFYAFVRMLRGALAHRDSMLREWPDWAKHESYLWSTFTLRKSDVGRPVDITPRGVFELHEEIVEYIMKDFY